MGIKVYSDQNVLEAAIERIETCFDRFDHVSVSFSGGKDSTTVFNLTYEVAKRLGRLPLRVNFYDEEAMHPPTIEYVERVRKLPGLDFRWYCLPFKHRNACSRKESWWYCWNPEEKEKWVRDLPEGAITHIDGFKIGMSIPDVSKLVHSKLNKSVVVLTGIRADESVRRFRAISKRDVDNWITIRGGREGHRAHPIYDWTTEDVWFATNHFQWDYNRTYDLFMKAGVTPFKQRVCQPFGEEPLRNLHTYATCFPSLWPKLLQRVPGAHAASMYANTDIYGIGIKNPPEGMGWREYIDIVLGTYNTEDRLQIKKNINWCIKLHHSKSRLPIEEEVPDPISGCSWKFLCKVAIKGDMKMRTSQNMSLEATKYWESRGLNLQKATKLYGR